MDYYDNAPLKEVERTYEGTVYIAVAAAAMGAFEAVHTVYALQRRPGDNAGEWLQFTKGVKARQAHTEHFLNDTDHDFILHLDGDMAFPADLLERLRSHRLPCVTGLYYRRAFEPMLPLWYEDDPEYRWPMMPFRGTPEPGRMYRLGATGAGCWLIHRSVYEAVRPLLKGELFWKESSMEVWPYNLDAVLAGKEKLRPLRRKKDTIGADMRLAFFIRQAGYTIWGDAAAACGHFVNYPIGLDDYRSLTTKFRSDFADITTRDIEEMRAKNPQNERGGAT